MPSIEEALDAQERDADELQKLFGELAAAVDEFDDVLAGMNAFLFTIGY